MPWCSWKGFESHAGLEVVPHAISRTEAMGDAVASRDAVDGFSGLDDMDHRQVQILQQPDAW